MNPFNDILNNPIIIDKIRERLVSEMRAHPELYDECDLERIKTNDNTTKRFLFHYNGDIEKTYVALRDAMKWRKSYEVNTRTDLDFPLEFYKIGALFLYSEDKEGRPVLYLRIKLFKHFPKICELFKAFIIHLLNKALIQTEEKGIETLFTLNVVYDLTGAGPSNWDFSMIRFINLNINNYFPNFIKYLILCSVPRLMNPFVNIGVRVIPEQKRHRVKNLSKEEILQIISRENLPDFMGGTCNRSYREVPAGALSVKNMADRNGISHQEIEKFLKYYEKELK